MNIFILDKDPKKIAMYHNDKHVVKMIVETAQLLCTAHHVSGTNGDIPYRKTHQNHPCSIWARESIENYNWLLTLLKELLDMKKFTKQLKFMIG
jgi:phage-related protein